MDTKTKIIKILPFWSGGLLLAVGLIAGFGLWQERKLVPVMAEPVRAQPKVLGLSTDLRGDLIEEKKFSPKQISKPNFTGISARSFLVFDLKTGETLLEKNPKTKLGIASLTKLMTALVAYKETDLNKSFEITSKDVYRVSPVLGLAVGDEVVAADVFNAMLVGSSNDAAVALANYTASSTGQNFIKLMNIQAKLLGMNNTNFSNVLGFDSWQNFSTAEDLKILITETQKLAAFSNLGRRRAYDFFSQFKNRYTALATNKLIQNHPEISAVKTGYTNGSLGAMVVKVEILDRDVIILVLGSKDREGDTLKLKDQVENTYQW